MISIAISNTTTVISDENVKVVSFDTNFGIKVSIDEYKSASPVISFINVTEIAIKLGYFSFCMSHVQITEIKSFTGPISVKTAMRG